MRALTGRVDSTPTTILDLSTATFEVQQDGNDETGYRLRLRASAGTATTASSALAIFVVQRDGKYFVAGFSNTPTALGMEALKLADDGKVELARTWLNWARELVSAGGGDEPLSGSPFARVWQKEKPTATLGEVRLAAAVLATGKEYASKSEPILVAARDKATADDVKTAVDLALLLNDEEAHDWAKLLPVSERLSRAYPDSGIAFRSWTTALTMLGKSAEAEALVKERLARRPKDDDAMRSMITIAAKKGDYDNAVMWARRVVDEITPTENDYNEAAWVALFRGTDLDRAIDDARRATSDERRASAAALHTLAALYAESGKSGEARQALLKSIERRNSEEPTSSDWFVLGRIAENYGVHDAAVAAYKRVDKEEASGLSTWELARKRMTVVGMK
jgi:tetratricopeptide (TPR) repeat protein